jgi:LysM repeat protein
MVAVQVPVDRGLGKPGRTMAALPIPLRAPRATAVPALLVAAFALLVTGLLAADAVGTETGSAAGRSTSAAADAAGGTASLPVVDVVSSYTVQPSDTLSEIAGMHGVTLEALAAANGLAPPFAVTPGQVVHVPAGTATGTLPGVIGLAPQIGPSIERWAQEYRLPPALLKAVTWRESRWRADAVSERGAIGVGQVLPETAGWVSANLVGARLDPWQVEDNLHLSAAYLRWLIDRSGGDEAAALAAYHQGRTSVLDEGRYSVTDRYIADVFELRWQFEAAAQAG